MLNVTGCYETAQTAQEGQDSMKVPLYNLRQTNLGFPNIKYYDLMFTFYDCSNNEIMIYFVLQECGSNFNNKISNAVVPFSAQYNMSYVYFGTKMVCGGTTYIFRDGKKTFSSFLLCKYYFKNLSRVTDFTFFGASTTIPPYPHTCHIQAPSILSYLFCIS